MKCMTVRPLLARSDLPAAALAVFPELSKAMCRDE